MKTRLFLSIGFALLTGAVSAQYRMEMSERVTRDEVPAVVQQSLQKQLHSLETDGNWELVYIETTIMNSHQAEFAPEFYAYFFESHGERIEYIFKPDGSLYQAKGAVKKGGKV